MVRLKERDLMNLIKSSSYFNSTMVRLKAYPFFKVNPAIVFQFHYGTIKRKTNAANWQIAQNFNSTMVRLKGKGIFAPKSPREISIPLWYD